MHGITTVILSSDEAPALPKRCRLPPFWGQLSAAPCFMLRLRRDNGAVEGKGMGSLSHCEIGAIGFAIISFLRRDLLGLFATDIGGHRRWSCSCHCADLPKALALICRRWLGQ